MSISLYGSTLRPLTYVSRSLYRYSSPLTRLTPARCLQGRFRGFLTSQPTVQSIHHISPIYHDYLICLEKRVALIGGFCAPIRRTKPTRLLPLIARRFGSVPANEWDELQKLSLGKRLKVMLKKYWYVAIPLHFVNCSLWFVALFILAKCGIKGDILINAIKPHVINSTIVPDFVKRTFEKDADSLGAFAVALLLYKIMTPARYATTVFGTVFALKHLMRKGVMVKTAGQQFQTVKNNYVNYATSKNLKRRAEKAAKKPKLHSSKTKPPKQNKS